MAVIYLYIQIVLESIQISYLTNPKDSVKDLKPPLKQIVSRRFQGCTIAIDMLRYKAGQFLIQTLKAYRLPILIGKGLTINYNLYAK
jgi:hypothetical protein